MSLSLFSAFASHPSIRASKPSVDSATATWLFLAEGGDGDGGGGDVSVSSLAGADKWFGRRFSSLAILVADVTTVDPFLALSRAAVCAGPWTSSAAFTTLTGGTIAVLPFGFSLVILLGDAVDDRNENEETCC